jgi:hypothetical protein
MTPRATFLKRASQGYALIMVLSLVACTMIVLTATLMRTATDSDLNARNNQYNAGVCAAEAATEKVLARIRYDYTSGQYALITTNMSQGIYSNLVPTSAENAYWGSFQFSDGLGHQNATYVAATSSNTFQSLDYDGLSGFVTTYRILSNVSQKTRADFVMTNAVQQDVLLEEIPVFQFAIFYNSLLEFTWAAPLTINGRVHSNTNIYVGSSSPLTFNSTVTASGTITDPPWFDKTVSQYTGGVTYNGTPGYLTNVPVMQLPIGSNNTPAAVQQILQMPPSGEDPNSSMGQQRYYNKAEVVIVVTNTSVTATLKYNVNDGSPVTMTSSFNPTNLAATNFTAVSSNFPFLSLTNYFVDQREHSKMVKVSQIDVGALDKWLVTNPIVAAKFTTNNGVYPNDMYFADNRNDTNTAAGNEFYAVRLVDAAAIPTNGNTGFTLATPDPLYVQGNYNAPNGANQGSTNVTGTMPASLISDALTILSANWNASYDNASSNSYTGRTAATTTLDAAIITGVVYSTGSGSISGGDGSGGVMNLPRLLEAWGSANLWLNTSIVNLFPSMIATNQFQAPGGYYTAPSQRTFSFNPSFLNYSKLPPGTPELGLIQKSRWTVPPPGTVTYNGY